MASATDIITYVGVPLAVVGVLPTMYTFSKSFVTARAVRKILAEHGIAALVRSSPLSGIVEVEIPRKSIVPLDRDDEGYFRLAPGKENRTDTLRGGAWAVFNWRELVIGSKVLRLQYHDELVLPQAEIELESLVAFLMDRGAVPDINGWADLRSSGLWTPAGTKLLLSPDTLHSVLSVASSEDSEGLLSLRIQWKPEWNRRTLDDLPPYWMRLHAPRDGSGPLGFAGVDPIPEKEEKEAKKEAEKEKEKVEDTDEKDKRHSTLSVTENKPGHKRNPSGPFLVVNPPDDEKAPRRPSTARTSVYSQIPHGFSLATIRMRLGSSGLEDLRPDEDHRRRRLLPRHLRVFRNEPQTSSAVSWFASAATALHAPYGGLWAYSVPIALSQMCVHDTVPCGVLDLLDMHPSVGSLPTWRTRSEEAEVELERIRRSEHMLAWSNAIRHEQTLPPAERQVAIQKRMMQEAQQHHFERGRQLIEQEKKKAEEMVEALNSARVGIKVVCDAAITYLKSKGLCLAKSDEDTTLAEEDQENKLKSGNSSETEIWKGGDTVLREIVERVLWEMIRSVEVTTELTAVLDAWRAWVENGGMTQKQFELIKEKQVVFAYAACILAVIAEAANGDSGISVVEDLQECMRIWKRVRVG